MRHSVVNSLQISHTNIHYNKKDESFGLEWLLSPLDTLERDIILFFILRMKKFTGKKVSITLELDHA